MTSAVRAGASLVSIQRQTGHASLDMLAHYIRELDLFTGNALTHMGRVGAVSVERTDETA